MQQTGKIAQPTPAKTRRQQQQNAQSQTTVPGRKRTQPIHRPIQQTSKQLQCNDTAITSKGNLSDSTSIRKTYKPKF